MYRNGVAVWNNMDTTAMYAHLKPQPPRRGFVQEPNGHGPYGPKSNGAIARVWPLRRLQAAGLLGPLHGPVDLLDGALFVDLGDFRKGRHGYGFLVVVAVH